MGPRTRVKLIASHCSPEQFCREWAPMAQGRSPSGGLIWNDIEVTWEDRDDDFYVIAFTPHGELRANCDDAVVAGAHNEGPHSVFGDLKKSLSMT